MKYFAYLALVGLVSSTKLTSHESVTAEHHSHWDWHAAANRAKALANRGIDAARHKGWLVQEGDNVPIDEDGKLAQLEQELESEETPLTDEEIHAQTHHKDMDFSEEDNRNDNEADESEEEHDRQEMATDENNQEDNDEDWDWKAAANRAKDLANRGINAARHKGWLNQEEDEGTEDWDWKAAADRAKALANKGINAARSRHWLNQEEDEVPMRVRSHHHRHQSNDEEFY